MNYTAVKLIECPRDAMQGWKNFIPTEKKIQYINSLLKIGFDTIDAGSFVSPKAIPQMADTKEVVGSLESGVGSTKLLAIDRVSHYQQCDASNDFFHVFNFGGKMS